MLTHVDLSDLYPYPHRSLSTDLHLDVEAIGGDLELDPHLRQVSLFFLYAKVSPVFSSKKFEVIIF
jgi:hypothetical protein